MPTTRFSRNRLRLRADLRLSEALAWPRERHNLCRKEYEGE
jgi:hypothetical protein